MGHRIDSEGLHPTDEKVEAIVKAPEPKNVSELRAFLGLINYYGKFLKNLSSLLHPLNELLQKDKSWVWTEACKQAFQKCKLELTANSVLVHYDPTKPLRLACDASPYGVGAVISHIIDGEERPIAYASRTLTASEKNYAQIEKEGLSIVYGVKKFHKYLYGRRFELHTDHKPLVTIFGPKKGIPPLAALRMQRWALILLAYTYDIVYRKSADHCNADGLSRLPWHQSDVATETGIYYFSNTNDLPISSAEIAEHTGKDRILCQVREFILGGWPSVVTDKALRPYWLRRDELSIEDNCILWGMRVVIPPHFRDRLLEEMHEGHPGVNRMKALSRSFVWWPNLDQDIEGKVKGCKSCMAVQNMPPVAPLHVWQWPNRIWQRVHIDFAEKEGTYFLVLIDSHSKWLEVCHMNTTTSSKTIDVLGTWFAAYGYPEELVSDNGPQFTSGEFEHFMQRCGIKHTRVAPYHPASNGAAERSVQILKRALEKQVLEGKGKLTIKQRLANFLIHYRNTPHSVTGKSPAESFLKRKPRTRLSLLKPNLAQKMEEKQLKQKLSHDKGAFKARSFKKNDVVRVRNHIAGIERWRRGIVLKPLGPLTYLVSVGGKTRYVHIDHLLGSTRSEADSFGNGQNSGLEISSETHPEETDKSSNDSGDRDGTHSFQGQMQVQVPQSQILPSTTGSPAPQAEGEPRYPKRLNRHPPKRLDL